MSDNIFLMRDGVAVEFNPDTIRYRVQIADLIFCATELHYRIPYLLQLQEELMAAVAINAD